MARLRLSPEQKSVSKTPLDARLFLSAPAGYGKTTAGVERLRFLLKQGVPGGSILILTPQRTLQDPYLDLIHSPEREAGGDAAPATVGGLARRMVDLFWPLAAEAAGFADPERPPVFLTIETAQYHMARLVRPLIDEGFFESVTIDRNRLYSQILDNLNKSAAVGFTHTEIGERLAAAWYGDPAQRRVYADAQECANRFRAYCLEHNLLDFSLQLEIFWNVLWRTPECHDYLRREYRHLIYDNVEEDVPVAHDLVEEWLPDFDSALVICDKDGGYRRFLGADPESALRLAERCETQVRFETPFVTSEAVRGLEASFSARLAPAADAPPASSPMGEAPAIGALVLPPPETPTHFYPQMLDWVAGEIQVLVDGGLPPSEIVVLAPYLPDSLRFSLSSRLDELGLPWRSHRPSRSLRDEPASHCLLTLAELSHPGWGLVPTRFDVAYALLYAIAGMDLVRAQLLAEIVYRPREVSLSSFDQIKPDVQERITFIFGGSYTHLRDWLEGYRSGEPEPLDHFLRRLFGEVLSQKGFGFHRNFDGARVAASLVESIQKFRQAMEAADFRSLCEAPPERSGGGEDFGSLEMGKEYIAMLQDGVIAAQYLEGWQTRKDEAVLIAPAFTFLMMNRPASVHFWLDAGSSGWWERLSQPLTQPHVLSRAWMQGEPGRLWTDTDEQAANRETLRRLVSGLLRRCRERVYLGLSDLGESGYEQRGPLLKAVWKMQLQASNEGTGHDV